MKTLKYNEILIIPVLRYRYRIHITYSLIITWSGLGPALTLSLHSVSLSDAATSLSCYQGSGLSQSVKNYSSIFAT